MADNRWSRLRELFDRVLELSVEERRSVFDRELADEPDLRHQLEALLRAHDAATGFLAERPTATTGATVGPYRLLEPIGEGGFGVVYLAEQFRPIRRRVALKLIKPGMDSKQVIARFDAERQALALMDHPGIAQVFDAGETEQGRPYFVMEHVPGLPITVFCDSEQLSLRERLALFVQACEALQHAHQKGVIHRDIKPSNILVTRREGAPALKVIDFGVAKATGEATLGGTTMTREGMIVGTAGYMSPEQLGAIRAPVDTRSDIYSLGVLLYELLAGDLPSDRERLRDASWLGAMQMIMADPPSPAERAARTDTAETAGRRSTDARTLLRALKGELEWITLRALEKEPDRRYPSASELAADIRRYLADEPVSVAAPGTLYRLSKYARRHRVGVTAAAFVVLALLAGAIAAGVGFRRAVTAERLARREAESSNRVADFLVNLFDASNPDRAQGRELTARSLLDEGAKRIGSSLKEDPLVRARLLSTMSIAYQNLGHYDDAIGLARQALAAAQSAERPPGRDVAVRLAGLAQALEAQGQSDSVGVLLDRAIVILQGTPAPDAKQLALCLYQKANWEDDHGHSTNADSLLTRALRLTEVQAEPDTTALLRICSTKASIAFRQYNLSETERQYLRTAELAEKSNRSSWAVFAHRRLANVYRALGDAEKTQLHADEGVRIARRIYAPGHPSLADALGGQVDALTLRKRYDEAIPVREECVRIRKAARDPLFITYELNSLGILYRLAGKPDSAIARLREACDVARQGLGLAHERTGEAMANLARTFVMAKQPRQADSTFRAAVAVFDRLKDASVFPPLASMDYANFCRDQGQLARADSFYVRAEAGLDSTNSALLIYRGACLVEHAYLRSLQGRSEAAERMIQAGMPLRTSGPDDPELGNPYLVWAAVRARAGNAKGAMEQLAQAKSHGASAEDVAKYAELMALKGRADYPLARMP